MRCEVARTSTGSPRYQSSRNSSSHATWASTPPATGPASWNTGWRASNTRDTNIEERAWRTAPSTFASSRSCARRNTGSNASAQALARMRSVPAAATVSACSSVTPNGCSTSTAAPASSASRATAARSCCGPHTNTAWGWATASIFFTRPKARAW